MNKIIADIAERLMSVDYYYNDNFGCHFYKAMNYKKFANECEHKENDKFIYDGKLITIQSAPHEFWEIFNLRSY